MPSLHERALAVLPPVASRTTDLGLARASGCWLWDESGDRYLDFGSGVAVANVGHNHPRVVEGAKAQIDRLVHGAHNVAYYEPYVEFAERLVALFGPGHKVYFSNSGAEAIEGAVKLARLATGRPAVVAFRRGFHGRTLGATALTASSAAYRRGYEPLMAGVYHADYPYAFRSGLSEEAEMRRCLDDLEQLLGLQVAPDEVAALLVEPIQGEGGYVVPPRRYLPRLRELCDRHGILLVLDEIQTGFGRTGELFAARHSAVQADVTVLAKGIANGFPLSAVVARDGLMDRWLAGTHGGTFGGNAVSCAAALAVLDTLEEEDLVTNARLLGEHLLDGLRALAAGLVAPADVRGAGLMIGFELLDEDGRPDGARVEALRRHALTRRVVLLPCGVDRNVIRLAPPLCVGKPEADRALEVLAEGLASC